MKPTVKFHEYAGKRWVVMGVSGCGKSEVGRLLGQSLGIAYLEGDDFHPPENIAKMAAGIPLNDQDRQAWLECLRQHIWQARTQQTGLVVSCSALKRRYRDLLREGDPELHFIFLDGERELIAQRMRDRSQHFMPLSLLDSQLQDLEPPSSDELALRLDIAQTPGKLIATILSSAFPAK